MSEFNLTGRQQRVSTGRQHKPWLDWIWGTVGASVAVTLVPLVLGLYGAMMGMRTWGIDKPAYGIEGATNALILFVLVGGWVILPVVAFFGMWVGVYIGRKQW